MDATMVGQSQSEAEESASLWEDFIEIFISPAQVFRRRRDGRWVVALIVLTIVMALLMYASSGVLATAWENMTRPSAEDMAQMSQAQIDRIESMAGMAGLFSAIGALIFIPFGAMISALVIWGVARLFGSATNFAVAAAIAVYSTFPLILQSLASIAQGIFLKPTWMHEVSLGPARLMNRETSPEVLFAIVSNLDIFTFWCAALVGVGLHVAAGLSRDKAVQGAVLVWVATLLPAGIQALFR